VRADGPDGYIAEDGTVMPVSDKFTSRVILLSGSYVKQILKQNNLNTTEDGKKDHRVNNMIRKTSSGKPQIAPAGY
jgi:cell division protein FtsQ